MCCSVWRAQRSAGTRCGSEQPIRSRPAACSSQWPSVHRRPADLVRRQPCACLRIGSAHHGLFNLVHWRNSGAAFGFLSTASNWRRPPRAVTNVTNRSMSSDYWPSGSGAASRRLSQSARRAPVARHANCNPMAGGRSLARPACIGCRQLGCAASTALPLATPEIWTHCSHLDTPTETECHDAEATRRHARILTYSSQRGAPRGCAAS